MSTGSYVPFSPDEAVVGVAYAREKYGIDLDPDFLADLANRTRSLMEREIKSFRDSRFQVLNGANLYSRTAAQKNKRDATEGALGKMFNARKQFAKLHKTPTPQLPANVSENKNGQFEMIF